MDHFLYPIFYVKQKNEDKLSIRSLIFFFKKHHQIPFSLALCLNASLGLSFVKRWQRLELLLQQIHLFKIFLRIVDSPFFQRQTSFPHTLSLKRRL